METTLEMFRRIGDQMYGVSTGQEQEDIDGKPFMYRYDFCAWGLPCFISFNYKTNDLVGCVWYSGYAIARKTRCISECDVQAMVGQIVLIQHALVESEIKPETYSTGPDYDVVGIWSARKGSMVIDDYVRVNEHDEVCAGMGYARMPLQQMISDSELEQKDDAVNAPKHYSWLGESLSKQVENVGDVEVFHVLMSAFANDPLLWQVGKYLLRAGRKDDRKQDLEKARWYLSKAIDQSE